VLKHGRGFLSIQGITDSGLRQFIHGSVVTASFKRAENFEREEEYEKAAKAFAEFHSEFPRDPNAPRALYNSFVNYQRANNTTKTLSAGRDVIRYFPSFEYADRVVGAMAEIHERTLNFEEAARYYLVFARRWASSSLAPRAIYNAGILLRAIEKPQQALSAWQLFHETFPNHQLASEALYEQAEIYRELNDYEQARKYYLQLASRVATTRVDLHAEALAKALLLLPERERYGRAGQGELTRLRNLLSDSRRVPAAKARELVSQVMLEKLKLEHNTYEKLDLVTSQDLDQGVQQRQQALVNLVQGYEEIIALGSPKFSIAAFYKIGLAHEQFAAELERYALLAEIHDDSLGESFNSAAAGLRQEAFQFYKTGYETAGQRSVMSDYVTKCYEHMSQMNPQEYRPFKQKHLEPGYLVTRI